MSCYALNCVWVIAFSVNVNSYSLLWGENSFHSFDLVAFVGVQSRG